MKKILLSWLLTCLSTSIFSQIETKKITDESIIPIEVLEASRYAPKAIKLELPSVISEKESEQTQDRKHSVGSYQFGYDIETSMNMNDGTWVDINNRKVWMLTVMSPGALSLSFIFSDVVLPLESSLYIMSNDNQVLFGPVMGHDIPQGVFSSDLIEGEKATIFVSVPAGMANHTRLCIKHIVHGFRELAAVESRSGNSCFEDITCYPQYMNQSRAITQIVNLNPGYACSGALMMNTARDFRPYILTAFHCLDANDDGFISESEKSCCTSALFRFNYKSSVCGGTSISPQYSYYIGAYYRAAFYDTDFLLLELFSTELQSNTNRTWLGWNRNTSHATNGVFIHHPDGQLMNISISNNTISSSNHGGSLPALRWVANFDIGIVLGGSSGAPLLNQNMQAIGQLQGSYEQSSDPCDWKEGWFGRICDSWEGGGTASSRLKDWLDPTGSCVYAMNSATIVDELKIEGPAVPTSNSQYAIANLFPNCSVSWSYTATTGTLTFSQSGNTCTLSNAAKDYVKGTLTANVYYGGSCIKTLTKTIDSAANFYGTYSQEGGQVISIVDGTSYYDPIPTTYFGDNGSMEFHKQLTATISSPLFATSFLHRTNGNAFPTTWHHNGSTVTYNPPRNGPAFMFIQGEGINTYDVYRFIVYLAPEPVPGGTKIDLACGDGTLTINLVNDATKSESDGDHGYGVSDTNDVRHNDDMDTYKSGLVWHVAISNIQTGYVAFTGTVVGSSPTISTADWPSGIYAVSADVEGVRLSGKVMIR